MRSTISTLHVQSLAQKLSSLCLIPVGHIFLQVCLLMFFLKAVHPFIPESFWSLVQCILLGLSLLSLSVSVDELAALAFREPELLLHLIGVCLLVFLDRSSPRLLISVCLLVFLDRSSPRLRLPQLQVALVRGVGSGTHRRLFPRLGGFSHCRIPTPGSSAVAPASCLSAALHFNHFSPRTECHARLARAESHACQGLLSHSQGSCDAPRWHCQSPLQVTLNPEQRADPAQSPLTLLLSVPHSRFQQGSLFLRPSSTHS
ncbi:UNVERIFIED_CONTAM: hypothetical protein FKN15_008468 [Acipenser sinensis]